MANFPAGARRRPQRPLPSEKSDTEILGTGQGRHFQFTAPEGQQAWLREAYTQAVNADTWHLGDKVDDKVRDAVLAGIAGAQPPMYRGPDRQYYFQNARTVEDAATREHRARHFAGKSLDEIAAAGMPGADEYVAMRRAREQREVKPPLGLSAPANENRMVANDNRAVAEPEHETAATISPEKSQSAQPKFKSGGQAFAPRIPHWFTIG